MRRALLLGLALSACPPSVDFTKGRPYTCDKDSECGNNWRCGLNHVCHEIGKGDAYPCRRDAGDCEASWACGVDNLCVDPNDAGNNACGFDSDCFQGKRCDVEGRCIDPTNELLGPVDSPHGPLTVIAPTAAPHGVYNSAVAYAIQPVTGDPQRDTFRGWTFAAATQTSVTLVTNYKSGQASMVVLDAGTTWGTVHQIATNDSTTFISADNDTYAMSVVGAPALTVPTPVHVAGGAPLGAGWDLRTSFLGNSGIVALATDGGNEFHVVTGLGAGPSRFGPVPQRTELLGYGQCLFSAPNGELWVQTGLDAGVWNRLDLPELGGTCSDAGAPLAMRVRGLQPDLLGVAMDTTINNPDDGGLLSTVAVFDVGDLLATQNGPDGGPAACMPASLACHDSRVKLRLGVCNACLLGDERLFDFFPLVLGQQYGVQSDCIENGLLHTYEVTQALDGTCDYRRMPNAEPQFAALRDPQQGGTNPFGYAKAGTHGELWGGDSLITARPVFLDRAPGGIFSPLGDAGERAVRLFANEWTFEIEPGGIASLDPKVANPIVSTVGGASAQAVFLDRTVKTFKANNITNLNATVAATDETFLPPYGARLQDKRDGGNELIVRSFDTIYSGHAQPGQVGAFTLLPRLVPAASNGIVGLVVNPAVDAGQLEGYALTLAGLFALSEDDTEAWSATPVATAPGTRLAILQDQGKGRVAYDDGRVYSLPSRVLLAQAVPDVHFRSFLQACNEAWALTDHGMMRLAPDDGGTGHWVSEPLDSADPVSFAPDALENGRMLVQNNTIYVFNAYGGGLTFTPQAGCTVFDGGM